MAEPIGPREPKHNVNQSVATSSKKTVATDSTAKKSRHITKKLYEQVSKTYSWWYPKYTPPGYNWKPTSQIGNVNPNLVEIILFIVDSGFSKHMTGNLKLLTSFMEKFQGMVKFGNDQIAPILGYGDLVQGTITIKWVYYVEGLNHNLFSIGQFCDADLEDAFWKSTCYIRDLKGNDLLTGTEFLNKTLHAYFSKEGIRNETSTARTPEQNGVVERRNSTLVEAARTMLSAAKVPLFFWAEAIATACFTQNRSLVIPRHEKTPYNIINAQKPSVKYFHIFGSLCYIVRDGENLDKIKEKGDACIFVGYSTHSKAYRVFNKRTRIIVETIHVNFDELPQMASDHISSDPVTTSNELELLYSLMFSELLNGTSLVVSKSSAIHAADNPDKRQQHHTTYTSTTTDVVDPPPLNI
ncbi:retrovirus-related pol polyprotein from transposon TNT 1-94 [Tanacetum coccineum]